MTKKTADIIVAAFDGNYVRFYDVNQISPKKLQELEPMLEPVERRTLEAAKEYGFGASQQLAIVVTSSNSYRTFELLDAIT